MSRNLTLLLVLAACLAAGCGKGEQEPQTAEGRAIKAFESLGAWITISETVPDDHVIGLGCHGAKFTDETLADLKELKNLASLEVNDTQVTDAGLRDMKKLTRLQSLTLHGTRITDAALKDLKACKDLVYLDLSGSRITGAGLADLRGLENLWALVLDDTPLTDAGLMNLRDPKDFPKLQVLYLRRTRTTTAAIEDLRRALPDVSIIAGQ